MPTKFKRSELLLALFGFATLAQAKDVIFGGTSREDNAFLGKSKLENGQCPVCGELTPRYVRQTYTQIGKCEGIPGTDTQRCSSTEQPYGEEKRLVECEKCSAAFFQRAEPVE